MNMDDSNEVIPMGHHKYANNLRFYGMAGNMRAEGIDGNIYIPNANLPAGTNECCGAFYDPVKKRILWFNYNSNTNHGLYQYSMTTGAITKLFLCNTDSATDIFRLNLDYPIHSAAIVYRPSTDGDLFYWTDGNDTDNNRPRYLNLDTVSTLAPFTEDMINAAKNAPLTEPGAAYLDDATVRVNNLRKKLFQFSYYWTYANGETSTLAPFSKVPLPVGGYDPDTQNDPTKNAYIRLSGIAGGTDSTNVVIVARESIGDSWGDWFLVEKLDRTQYSISANGAFFFNFYNDGIYTSIDLPYSNLYFDDLPDLANTLELLNGNVIIYAGTTKGYNSLTRSDVNVNVTTANGSPNVPSLSYVTSGGHDFTMYVGATITVGCVYHVEFSYSSGAGGDASPKSVNYTTIGGDTQASIAIALDGLLTGNNITVDDLGGGGLRVRTTTGTGSITSIITTVSVAGSQNQQAAWKWNCPQRFALIYFDDRGKPIGSPVSFLTDSIDTTNFEITTPDFQVSSSVIQVPFVNAIINHTPPANAVSYQWLRAALTPNFTYWITNDYQSDSDYLYFCIQNLTYQQSKISGFVPTYDFSQGDHIRVLAKYNAGTITPYNIFLDFEVLGVVERTMTSPATTGRFIKVKNPTTLPSTAYSAYMYVELYTPQSRVSSDLQVYYEWGEKYDIYEYSAGVYYHAGQINNQTPTQGASFKWYDGDVYAKNRALYQDVNATSTVTVFMMDANYSDFTPSKINSNGRGWSINEHEKKIYNGVQLQWGQSYLQDTDVNNLNRFYPTDFDTIDRAKGDIKRLMVEGRLLYVYQERGVGSFGIYSKYIQNNQGTNQLVTTNDIITSNNVSYLDGEYGLGNQPTGLVRSKGAHYFCDPVRGYQVRRAGDGLMPISELYKGQYAIRSLLVPYNQNYLRPNGKKAKILGFYDFYEEQYHALLQGGTLDGYTIESNNFSFNEGRNGYASFYDYHPEWGLCAEDTIFTWKNGNLYIHNDDGADRKFYGQSFKPSIKLVFNEKEAVRKKFMALGYQSNNRWVCPTIGDINTSMTNEQTGLPQISQLIAKDFTLQENTTVGAFLRDANSLKDSREALVDGDFLGGNWIEINLVYLGSDFVWLIAPYVNYIISQRNF